MHLLHVRRGPAALAGVGVVAAVLIAACTSPANPIARSSPSSSTPSGPERVTGGPHGTYLVAAGIHKIKHVIVVMQENRSFDSYFGTYPGVTGIPMKNGKPTVCVPNAGPGCTKPYHDVNDVNGGGPHGEVNAVADVNGGKMNGFVKQRATTKGKCTFTGDPACASTKTPDVMGYHTAAEIPNYWAYARNFVLQDHMFEPVKSWSLPDHLYMVSAWSAKCKSSNPMSCVNDISGPYGGKKFSATVAKELATGQTQINLAWTDISWLLYMHKISWAFYVQKGLQPDCANDSAVTCPPVKQSARTPGIWNPLPLFNDVRSTHQLSNIEDLTTYFSAAKAGTLPSVSWITPSDPDSEHPPASVHQGQAYTTAVINAAMMSPDWSSTAIFLAWDDWGGFYDNVVPPGWTRMATACGCPRWSSRRTPGRATSTTRSCPAMPT